VGPSKAEAGEASRALVIPTERPIAAIITFVIATVIVVAGIFPKTRLLEAALEHLRTKAGSS